MKKGALGRLGRLVFVGVVASAVVAAIAFASSQKGGGAKMTMSPSITVALGDAAPFTVLSARMGVAAPVKVGRTISTT
jgi:hypothetical protein